MTTLLTRPAAAYHRSVARTRRQFGGAPSMLDLALRVLPPARVAAALYPRTFDPAQPYLTQVIAHIWAFATRTRLRRFTIAPLLLALVYGTVTSTLFPPTAHAASPVAYFLGMTDTYGINPGMYTVSTDFGSLFSPGNTPRAILFNILSAAYVDIVALGIFVLSWVLSFQFLRDLLAPFADAAQTSAAQLLGPFTLACVAIAGTVAAFAFFRGRTSTGVKYLASSMLIGIVATALFTSTPISWTLSDKGPLMSGRDFGVSVATGTSPRTGAVTNSVTTLQQEMLTNLLRRPLQVWNFGAVVDNTPSCAAAWNAGVKSGDPDRIKDGIASCGASNSAAMKASADNPSWSQVIGGGVSFGFLGLMTCIFCLAMSFKVMSTAFKAVVEAFKLCFAMVMAYIPGAPQILFFNIGTRLMFSFVGMAAYTALTMFTATAVMKILNSNAQRGPIYAVVIATISMVLILIATFKSIGRGVDNAADAAAAALARGTDNTSAIVQPGTTINSGGSLPALAGAAAGGWALAKKAHKSTSSNKKSPTSKSAPAGQHLPPPAAPPTTPGPQRPNPGPSNGQGPGNGPGPRPRGPRPSTPPPNSPGGGDYIDVEFEDVPTTPPAPRGLTPSGPPPAAPNGPSRPMPGPTPGSGSLPNRDAGRPQSGASQTPPPPAPSSSSANPAPASPTPAASPRPPATPAQPAPPPAAPSAPTAPQQATTPPAAPRPSAPPAPAHRQEPTPQSPPAPPTATNPPRATRDGVRPAPSPFSRPPAPAPAPVPNDPSAQDGER